jgi:hypothetical protein
MALQFLDSVGHEATADLAAKGITQWGEGVTVEAGLSREGGPALKIGSDAYCRYGPVYPVPTPAATVSMHWAGRVDALVVGKIWQLVVLYAVEGVQCSLWVSPDGSLQAGYDQYGDFTAVGDPTTPGVVVGGVNYSFELTVTLHVSAGAIVLKVNGAEVLNLTGIRTTGTTTGTLIDQVKFGSSSNNGTFAYCSDVAIGLDAGDVRVDPQFPTANGSDRDWTRSAGSDDFSLVNDATPDTATRLSSSTVGDRVSVVKEPMRNAGGTLKGVQVVAYASKTDAGPCGLTAYLLIGGTRYYGAEFFPSFGSWAYFLSVWDLNPATSGAWTESAFNAAQVGIEHTTAS